MLIDTLTLGQLVQLAQENQLDIEPDINSIPGLRDDILANFDQLIDNRRYTTSFMNIMH